MSLRALLWAMTEATVTNVGEWAVLVAMADAADESGEHSYLSVETIAKRTTLGASTVRRHRAALVEAGLIAHSDDIPPSLLAIPEGKRPACFTLLLMGSQIGRGPTSGPNPLILSSSLGSSSEVAAAANHVLEPLDARDLDEPQRRAEDEPPVTSSNQGLAWTEVHLLRSWFGIERREQVEAWQQAWRTAVQVDDGTFDPTIHLNAYLVRCRDERRVPSASRWLKFFIEDRESHAAAARARQDRLEQQAQADGGEQWALNSLSRTPKWEGKQ